MLVTSTFKNLQHFPLSPSNALHQPLLKRFPQGLTLLPGVNDVDPDLFTVALDHRIGRHLLESGQIVFDRAANGATADGSKPPVDTEISKLPTKKAVALVEDCIDTALLNRWLGEEKRREVVKALNAQLKALEIDGAKPEKAGGEEETVDAEGGE